MSRLRHSRSWADPSSLGEEDAIRSKDWTRRHIEHGNERRLDRLEHFEQKQRGQVRSGHCDHDEDSQSPYYFTLLESLQFSSKCREPQPRHLCWMRYLLGRLLRGKEPRLIYCTMISTCNCYPFKARDSRDGTLKGLESDIVRSRAIVNTPSTFGIGRVFFSSTARLDLEAIELKA